jgi:uncharacterized membrane protein (DUF485 family)
MVHFKWLLAYKRVFVCCSVIGVVNIGVCFALVVLIHVAIMLTVIENIDDYVLSFSDKNIKKCVFVGPFWCVMILK